MMALLFVGRKNELATLDRLWDAGGAQFLILYGRRRVGKTALLVHWMHQSRRRTLYWVATSDSALAQLRSFSQAVINFANPRSPAPESFTYASWEQAWQEIARLASEERLALFIDEFTFLLETTPGIASHLQNFWDQVLRDCNLLLVISGSNLGMMKREFLAYQAPLYGRATAQLYLQPLPFGLIRAYFPNYSAVDRVALYAMFGGIPAYWERVDRRKSVSQNIKQQLLTANNLMQAEPRLLLQDFISAPHTYLAVLTALANGSRTPKEIASYTGLPNVQAPKYLSVLNEAGFVERRTSMTAAPGGRAGRYQISDPYLRFYFRFLANRQAQLALGVQDQALEEINRHMIDFIGTHTWEELCREWVFRASGKGELPFLPDEVGSAWNASTQIDVAGINTMQKTLILGECKWTLSPGGRRVLEELIEEKTGRIVPEHANWRIYYLGFSRSGWKEEALNYQAQIEQRPPTGKNWQIAGLRLLDLEQVDLDLEKWS
jgi:AAA+ ATPase superfamily predicted ATPase